LKGSDLKHRTPGSVDVLRGNLREVAYDGIREMIVCGELAPGDRVMEKDCAERLGISRTPVREAIGRLTSEGLISRSNGGAPVVNRISADDIIELLHVRRLLEVEAARRACDAPGREGLMALRRGILELLDGERPTPAEHMAMDDRLHDTLARMARSNLLAELIANLRLRTRIFDKSLLPDRFEPGCREHIEILDAVIHGDADRAEAAMRLHLNAVADSILEHLKRYV
jgi:DNA-binding GntR family transcriptional regulator